MLQHPCPRCGVPIPYGVPYCNTCKPLAEAQRAEAREHRKALQSRKANRGYNARRDKTKESFYHTGAWRAMSHAKLSAVGWQCEAKLEGCRGVACEVHHKKPLSTAEGWAERLEYDNLMAVCVACHNRLDSKNGGRKKQNEDGVIDLRHIDLG